MQILLLAGFTADRKQAFGDEGTYLFCYKLRQFIYQINTWWLAMGWTIGVL